jgi:hypothetical protein
MLKHFLMSIFLVALAVSAAVGQEKKAVPPPPKPADEGPSLEVTMKFIQKKLAERDGLKWTWSADSQEGYHIEPVFETVEFDLGACQERWASKTVESNGTTDTAQWLYETTLSFRNVEKIEVLPYQDFENRRVIESGHPEQQGTMSPAGFYAVLAVMNHDGPARLKVTKTTLPGRAVTTNASSLKKVEITMEDEDSANRLAKAMVHAVELCGGGSKPEAF